MKKGQFQPFLSTVHYGYLNEVYVFSTQLFGFPPTEILDKNASFKTPSSRVKKTVDVLFFFNHRCLKHSVFLQYLFMMINFGSLLQIGIRDSSLKLCEKERNKKKYFLFSMGSNERKEKKRKCFFQRSPFEENLIQKSTKKKNSYLMLVN